jgi:hypothetical protein
MDNSASLKPARMSESKFAGNGAGLCDGFAPDGIHDRLVGQSNIPHDETPMQPEVFELPDVNHDGIQTPIAPIVHLKLNSGKEPLQVQNSECGVQSARPVRLRRSGFREKAAI